ncbi:MAG: hypothetical protein K940chlam3_00247 [Chlamydiae bacterium]|nr:hypothetical protein [Chlamydiota bacterium]
MEIKERVPQPETTPNENGPIESAISTWSTIKSIERIISEFAGRIFFGG